MMDVSKVMVSLCLCVLAVAANASFMTPQKTEPVGGFGGFAPPPGPPEPCGGLGAACCGDRECDEFLACAPLYIVDPFDYAFTCQECGGHVEYDDEGSLSRSTTVACPGDAPCEPGFEVSGCAGPHSAPECLPCGQLAASCCNVGNPCEEGLGCLWHNQCWSCGGLGEPACPGADGGADTCSDGLTELPASSRATSESRGRCLPPVPCGSAPGAACCPEDTPCFGTDDYGNELDCMDGSCQRCGARGTVPCSDGCGEGLVEVRGFCRGSGELLCGQAGEICCGFDDFVNAPSFGPECAEGLGCRFGEDSDNGMAPSASSVPLPTCEPCGGHGQSPCGGMSEVNSGLGICSEGLEPDSGICGPTCGGEGAAPCIGASDCPCKQGLLLSDSGICEVPHVLAPRPIYKQAPMEASSPYSALGPTSFNDMGPTSFHDMGPTSFHDIGPTSFNAPDSHASPMAPPARGDAPVRSRTPREE